MASKFIKVKCIKCKNEQNIYSKPTTNVKCLVCGSILAKSSSGKAKILTKILEILD